MVLPCSWWPSSSSFSFGSGREERRVVQLWGRPIEASVTEGEGVRVAMTWPISSARVPGWGRWVLLESVVTGREKRPRLSSGQRARR